MSLPSSPEPAGGAAPRRINGVGVALAVLVLLVVAFLAARQFFGPDAVDRPTASTGRPAIGGPFTLIDQNGRSVSDTDFRGRYMLVFFGYTYCPDICPAAMGRASEVVAMLGDRADRVVPIFISVDPARDTPDQLKAFASFFDPRLVALTGSEARIAEVVTAYRVYHAKVAQEGDDADAYLIDHSAITYLMGPDGSFVTHFGHQTSADAIAARLRQLL